MANYENTLSESAYLQIQPKLTHPIQDQSGLTLVPSSPQTRVSFSSSSSLISQKKINPSLFSLRFLCWNRRPTKKLKFFFFRIISSPQRNQLPISTNSWLWSQALWFFFPFTPMFFVSPLFPVLILTLWFRWSAQSQGRWTLVSYN